MNTNTEHCLPTDFRASHHVHVLVRRGLMSFSDGRTDFRAEAGDFVIWQMSNNIQNVQYSNDFEADFLIVAPEFLQHFNPEMKWATKGYVFIRLHPVFTLAATDLELINADFDLFRSRGGNADNLFQRDIVGRVLQIFLFDLWQIVRHSLSAMNVSDNASQQFFRFLNLVQTHVVTQRGVAFYADKMCISAKYLSQLCREVTNLPPTTWIGYFATFEIISRLDNPALSLTEIADEMQFSSLQFFSRYVKSNLGVSPSEYRGR
ncbi:MAG: AraC family transcriptional regulator [Salinivirgaceae bacterium]|nr:AraC family transcriptional regulator [Salinivirgaceae bacterium]